ncbi:MAG: uroporphyrinogen decarboxylase family protein [bacterium]
MNHRQRIITLLKGNTPDRVPWLADLDYWTEGIVGRGELPRDFKRSEAYFELHRELRVGYYLQGYFPFETCYDPSVIEKRWEDGNDRFCSLQTPLGTLRERSTYMPDSFTAAPQERMVKSVEDLRILRYIYEHTSFVPDYGEAKRRLGLLKDLGIVLCYTPKTPFMQLVVYCAGIETVVSLAMDAEEELAETLAVMEAKLDEGVKIAVASPAECLMIPENLSSEVVGKRFFETYMRECQTKWVNWIRDAGKYSFIHIDGTLRGLLHEESSVGFDVLEALTPAPVGDLAITEWREMAGPNPILWGGLPGLYFTPLVSDEEFDRFVREILEVMRQEPKYVLGVADQVPPDGLRYRIERVADLAERYGRYE